MSHPRPPIPPQPLPEPPPIPGARWIPLHKMVGGSRRWPRLAIVAYTLVDEEDYKVQSLRRWSGFWSPYTASYYANRTELIGGKTVAVFLHREILGLPRNPGRNTQEVVDHISHNTLDCRRSNLRIATRHQNQANRRRRRDARHRFTGVYPHRRKYQVQFGHNGKQYSLGIVPIEAHAAFMFNHAISILRGEFAVVSTIPPDELPDPDTQAHLISLTEAKLQKLGLTG